MTKRIIAITFIFICTSIAWAILGGTIFSRTYDSGLVSSPRVASLWGTRQNQAPPTASFHTKLEKKLETYENGKKVVKPYVEEFDTPLPLESSRIKVDLGLEHRQKGLLWYSTYKVVFAGTYLFTNSTNQEQSVTFTLSW